MAYLAYNRPIKEEATRRFGRTAAAYTAHGLAFEGLRLKQRLRGRKLGRIYPNQICDALDLSESTTPLPRVQYAEAVSATLDTFLHRPEPIVSLACIPYHVRSRVDERQQQQLATHASDLFFACCPEEPSRLPLPHDLYLKYWTLIGSPGLERFDTILLDEAQDANAVMLAGLDGQRAIYVGDSHQQIYSYRGAVDAMDRIEAPTYPLVQSYRFGERIARLANAILRHKRITKLEYPLRGLDRIQSEVVDRMATAGSVRIYRTNYQLIADAVVLKTSGCAVEINGDMTDLARQLRSANALARGNRHAVRDPLIRSFATYEQLKMACESGGGMARELRQIDRILSEYGPRLDELTAMLEAKKPNSANSNPDRVLLTTAHKSKGCEWPRVAVMSDFDQLLCPESELAIPAAQRDEELNLLYVAVTRASETLAVQGQYLRNVARQAGLL